jgi:hypothetical protein
LNSADYRNYALALLAATSVVAVTFVSKSTINLLKETKETVRLARPKILETLNQSESAMQQAQKAMKAFNEEAMTPVEIYQRRQVLRLTNEVLGETRRTINQFNKQTVPELTAAISQTRGFVALANQQVNRELFPEMIRATRNLADIAERFKTDEQAVMAQLIKLVEGGTVSLDSLNKLLASEQLTQLLANVNSASTHFDGTAANIEEMSKRWPEMADRINKILKTTNQFQKPLMVAMLLATLARVFY